MVSLIQHINAALRQTETCLAVVCVRSKARRFDGSTSLRVSEGLQGRPSDSISLSE